MNAIWNVRGLDLNGTLDSDNTLLNVLSDILHIGYSELSTRADGLQIVQIGEHPNINYSGSYTGPTDYSFIFSPQNYSNLKIDVALPRRDDAEEIEVQYTDVETYKTATVYIHMSASQYSAIEVTDYPTSIYQEKLQLFGVTEKAQAVAMGARRLRTINPPLTAEQYGSSYVVTHRPTAFFITDEEGQPHLLSISYNDWINAKSFRATLPVTWYGEDIELPRIAY